MSKPIKMVSLIEGAEVVVGTCHPGQARILRKHGLAEWSKDRLLLSPSAGVLKPIGELSRLLRAPPDIVWDDPQVPGAPGVRIALAFQRTPEMILALGEDVQEIDPEGILNRRNHPRVEERDCETLQDWVLEINSRRAKGHTLFTADDPKRLKLGFVDNTENLLFLLSLRKIKQVTEEEWTQLGIPKTVFQQLYERGILVEGASPEFSYSHRPLPRDPEEESPDEADATLEGIWMAETEELRQALAVNQNQDLSSLASKPLPGIIVNARASVRAVSESLRGSDPGGSTPE